MIILDPFKSRMEGSFWTSVNVSLIIFLVCAMTINIFYHDIFNLVSKKLDVTGLNANVLEIDDLGVPEFNFSKVHVDKYFITNQTFMLHNDMFK